VKHCFLKRFSDIYMINSVKTVKSLFRLCMYTPSSVALDPVRNKKRTGPYAKAPYCALTEKRPSTVNIAFFDRTVDGLDIT